jgi:hypothetical protein
VFKGQSRVGPEIDPGLEGLAVRRTIVLQLFVLMPQLFTALTQMVPVE